MADGSILIKLGTCFPPQGCRWHGSSMSNCFHFFSQVNRCYSELDCQIEWYLQTESLGAFLSYRLTTISIFSLTQLFTINCGLQLTAIEKNPNRLKNTECLFWKSSTCSEFCKWNHLQRRSRDYSCMHWTSQVHYTFYCKPTSQKITKELKGIGNKLAIF